MAKPLAYPGCATGTPAELEAVAADCRALGLTALPFAADVRSAGNLLAVPQVEPADVAAVVLLASDRAAVRHRLAVRARRRAAHAVTPSWDGAGTT